MKKLKLMMSLVAWCGVCGGCVADEKRNPSSENEIPESVKARLNEITKKFDLSANLFIEENNSLLCAEYVDFFNHPLENNISFRKRNLDSYMKGGIKNSVLTTPLWINKSEIIDKKPTSFTDMLESWISERAINFKSDNRVSFEYVGRPLYLFEAFEDINRDGSIDHLIAFQNQEYPGQQLSSDAFTSIVFVIDDSKNSISFNNNKYFFPAVYDDSLCDDKNYEIKTKKDESQSPPHGIQQWVFKYKDKYYYDVYDYSTHNKKKCIVNSGSNADKKSNRIYVYEIGSKKPVCVFSKNEK